MARRLRSSVVGAAVDAYDRHVGRYGPELAIEMVRVAGVRAGQRALDVGSGTGALTVASLAAYLHSWLLHMSGSESPGARG